ncbi:MAG: YfcE family phosphodiesterase, partial [Desulfuromusa sp.]
MKIGVLSDTHLHSLDAGMILAQKLLDGPFADVEAILHAGDQTCPDLDSCFYPIPWYGVRGNMDGLQSLLPTKRIVALAQKRIGLVHGWGAPTGIEKRVMDSFSGDDINVLVFGHSHRPVCRMVGKILLFNPGSPTDRRSAPYHT